MNVELLRKVQKHILEEPKRLVMWDWIRKAVHGANLFYRGKQDEIIDREYAPCKTAACIAGWTAIIGRKLPTFGEHAELIAGKLLELNFEQKERLFFVSMWPPKFRKSYVDDGSKKSAQTAAARIEHFIKTKGAE